MNRSLLLVFALVFVYSCTKDEDLHKTALLLKTGAAYSSNGQEIKLGGQIKIGILASGAGVPLTYLRIERISGNDTVVQIDRGVFIESEGLDQDFTFSKDTATVELWRVIVMNADRDTAVRQLRILKADGSDWRPIKYFENIEISLQDNISGNHYLDIDQGLVYNDSDVLQHTGEIDVLAYFYFTSGLPSPSLTCPGYTSALGYYPSLASWQVKNNTLYDYLSTDNNLISPDQFNSALNDSLLVTAYKPEKVSGNCKYCYTGKIIPFRTTDGKYGLLRIDQADNSTEGSIRLSIKIQE